MLLQLLDSWFWAQNSRGQGGAVGDEPPGGGPDGVGMCHVPDVTKFCQNVTLSATFFSFSVVPAPIFAWKLIRVLQHFSDPHEYLAEIWSSAKFCRLLKKCIFQNLEFSWNVMKNRCLLFQTDFFEKCWIWSGAKVCKSRTSRSWKILKTAYEFTFKHRFGYSRERARQKLQKQLANVCWFC